MQEEYKCEISDITGSKIMMMSLLERNLVPTRKQQNEMLRALHKPGMFEYEVIDNYHDHYKICFPCLALYQKQSKLSDEADSLIKQLLNKEGN